MKTNWIASCAAMAAIMLGSAALADKGLGEFYNMKYNSFGITKTFNNWNGDVSVLVEDIQTVNCSGCNVSWMAPGIIFHLRNNLKEPLCVKFNFTPMDDDYSLNQWGNGQAYYIKGGKTLKKAAGLYDFSDGSDQTVNLSYTGNISSWAPGPDKSCAGR